MNSLSLFVFCIITCSTESAKFIPNYIKTCERNDPNLQVCFKSSWITTYKHMNDGIPEMNLRQLEPLVVDKVTLDYGNGSVVSINVNFTNLTLHGLSAGKLEDTHIDLDKLKFEFTMSLHELYLHGGFKARGRVLLLNFDSQGVVYANVSDISANGTWWAKKIQKNGKEHLFFKDTEIEMDIKDMNIHFDNLFPVEVINERANEVINENIVAVYEDMKPLLLDVIKSIADDSVNSVYGTFPFDVLFPK